MAEWLNVSLIPQDTHNVLVNNNSMNKNTYIYLYNLLMM